MSIETRLRDTLDQHAGQAPDHEPMLARLLVDTEREPVRTRRRWVAPAAAAPAHRPVTRCAAEDGIVPYPVGRHDGVFAAAATRGKIGLLVRSPDQALVERILASVRAVGDDEALVRPDLVEVTPPDASPGELVELTYPRRTMRGVAFALDELVDVTRVRRYYLTAARLSVDAGPDWWSVDDADGERRR